MKEQTQILTFFVTILLMVLCFGYLSDGIHAAAIAPGAPTLIVAIDQIFPYLYFTSILVSLATYLWRSMKT